MSKRAAEELQSDFHQLLMDEQRREDYLDLSFGGNRACGCLVNAASRLPQAPKHLGRGVGSAHRTLEGVSEYSGDAATPTCLIEPFTTGFKQFNSNTGWTANLDA